MCQMSSTLPQTDKINYALAKRDFRTYFINSHWLVLFAKYINSILYKFMSSLCYSSMIRALENYGTLRYQQYAQKMRARLTK